MSDLKTVNIKGKDYVEVSERLKYFRENFQSYSLLTEIIELTQDRVVMKAKIINDKGVEVANGVAYEKEGNGYINKTSFIENCETSAWGRALANFGIGIDASVASADEVINAINNQNTNPTPKKKTGEEIKAEEERKAALRKEIGNIISGNDKLRKKATDLKKGKETKDLSVSELSNIVEELKNEQKNNK